MRILGVALLGLSVPGVLACNDDSQVEEAIEEIEDEVEDTADEIEDEIDDRM